MLANGKTVLYRIDSHDTKDGTNKDVVGAYSKHFIFEKRNSLGFWLLGASYKPSFNYALKLLNSRPHRIIQAVGFLPAFCVPNQLKVLRRNGYTPNLQYNVSIVSRNVARLHENIAALNASELHDKINQQELAVFYRI